MRSIRNTAVAGVTALAVSLSGVAFAAGETPNNDTNNASLSSKYSKEYEGDKAVTGADAFGNTKLPKNELPKWFNAWEGFTIAGIVLTVLTNLIAPAYNYLKFNGII